MRTLWTALSKSKSGSKSKQYDPWPRKIRRLPELELDRSAAMLSRLGGRGYSLKEGSEAYGKTDFDPDLDERS